MNYELKSNSLKLAQSQLHNEQGWLLCIIDDKEFYTSEVWLLLSKLTYDGNVLGGWHQANSKLTLFRPGFFWLSGTGGEGF